MVCPNFHAENSTQITIKSTVPFQSLPDMWSDSFEHFLWGAATWASPPVPPSTIGRRCESFSPPPAVSRPETSPGGKFECGPRWDPPWNQNWCPCICQSDWSCHSGLSWHCRMPPWSDWTGSGQLSLWIDKNWYSKDERKREKKYNIKILMIDQSIYKLEIVAKVPHICNA